VFSLTVKVLDALVAPVMLPPRGVIPFHAEPVARRARHGAKVPDGADQAVVGEALADLELGACRHIRGGEGVAGAADSCSRWSANTPVEITYYQRQRFMFFA
jgi:hypothetical protein